MWDFLKHSLHLQQQACEVVGRLPTSQPGPTFLSHLWCVFRCPGNRRASTSRERRSNGRESCWQRESRRTLRPLHCRWPPRLNRSSAKQKWSTATTLTPSSSPLCPNCELTEITAGCNWKMLGGCLSPIYTRLTEFNYTLFAAKGHPSLN